MNWLLEGFADEMQKISKEATPQLTALREVKLRAKADRDVEKVIKEIGVEERAAKKSGKKDYAASAGFGALTMPAIGLASAAVRRKVVNAALKREVGKAGTVSAKKALVKKLEKGPLMSSGDVAGQAAKGAIMGSLYQAVKDQIMDGAGKSR